MLELGTTRSSTWTELGGFGTDPDLTESMGRVRGSSLRCGRRTASRFRRPVVPRARTQRAAEADAGATPADVGHGRDTTAARRRGSRTRLPGRSAARRSSPSRLAERPSTAVASTRASPSGRSSSWPAQNFLYCHEDLDIAADRSRAHGSGVQLLELAISSGPARRIHRPRPSLGNQATRAMKETGAPGDRRPARGHRDRRPGRRIIEIVPRMGVGRH